MRHPIPVCEPLLDEVESEYLNDALKKEAISGFFGEYLDRFESEFSRYCGVKHGVAVSNGTTAIHLALVIADIGQGDEVLVATYTNMASFFPVHYLGATPIPIDIEPDTCNIDPLLIEAKVTTRTKAIIVVHIFGHPVDMDPVMDIARRHNLKVIEDCAEAHGSVYRGKRVGSIGDIGCFSFYANKIITTGEGGMLVLNDDALAARARSARSLAFGKQNKFMHSEIGYNYRMTNLQAAIGCAQMKKIDKIVARRREVAARYNSLFAKQPHLRLPVEKDYATNVYWMYHIVLEPDCPMRRDQIMVALAAEGIETRPGFIPYNQQTGFAVSSQTRENSCPVANYVGANSFYLPSGPRLTDEEIDFVASRMIALLRKA